MSWADIRTATALKLATVTDVENVLDYVVWTDDWDFIITNFSKDGRINHWMVGLGSNTPNEIDGDLKKHTYLMNIFAYYSLKTSNQSSKVFEDLVMTVRDEFMKSFDYIKTFMPATTGSYITRPPSIPTIENVVYLQQACHRMQMQIVIEETIAEDLQCSG